MISHCDGDAEQKLYRLQGDLFDVCKLVHPCICQTYYLHCRNTDHDSLDVNAQFIQHSHHSVLPWFLSGVNHTVMSEALIF